MLRQRVADKRQLIDVPDKTLLEVSKTLGILPIDITIGSKTALSAFFVIDSTANYNILLGRDWIHANWCVSSSLH